MARSPTLLLFRPSLYSNHGQNTKSNIISISGKLDNKVKKSHLINKDLGKSNHFPSNIKSQFLDTNQNYISRNNTDTNIPIYPNHSYFNGQDGNNINRENEQSNLKINQQDVFRLSLTQDEFLRLNHNQKNNLMNHKSFIDGPLYEIKPLDSKPLIKSLKYDDYNTSKTNKRRKKYVIEGTSDIVQVLLYFHHINIKNKDNPFSSDSQSSKYTTHFEHLRTQAGLANNILCIVKCGEPSFVYIRGRDIDIKLFLIEIRKLRWKEMILLKVARVDRIALDNSQPSESSKMLDIALDNWKKNWESLCRYNMHMSRRKTDDPINFCKFNRFLTNQSTVQRRLQKESLFYNNPNAEYKLKLDKYISSIKTKDLEENSKNTDIFDPELDRKNQIEDKYISKDEKEFKKSMSNVKMRRSLLKINPFIESKLNTKDDFNHLEDTPRINNVKTTEKDDLTSKIKPKSIKQNIELSSLLISKTNIESTHSNSVLKPIELRPYGHEQILAIQAQQQHIHLEKHQKTSSILVCISPGAKSNSWESVLRHFGGLRLWLKTTANGSSFPLH